MIKGLNKIKHPTDVNDAAKWRGITVEDVTRDSPMPEKQHKLFKQEYSYYQAQAKVYYDFKVEGPDGKDIL